MSPFMRPAICLGLALLVSSCGDRKAPIPAGPRPAPFDPSSLAVPDAGGRRLRGQVLYMPVYSNIPFRKDQNFDLSAFLAIHNTDLKRSIRIKTVDFFDTDGTIVDRFLTSERRLAPLATAVYTIPKRDQSGAGANFLVEWIADEPVSEPLVESIMKDLTGNLGISFMSLGRIVREF